MRAIAFLASLRDAPGYGSAIRVVVVLVLLAVTGCKSTPTSILLTIEGAVGLPLPDELRLNVYTFAGVTVSDRRLPQAGAPRLPDTVVLFPSQNEGDVRILVRALAGGAEVGQGATTVTLRSGEQVPASVVLRSGTALDRDGDGVPDAIDNCPDWPNPDQERCPADGGVDASVDAPADTLADLADLVPDLACDQDNDTYLSLACGGLDCDDTDDTVNPGRTEGPPGDPTCSDGKDNDCDGGKDLADTACKTCSVDGDCEDNNSCTVDKCSGGLCDNSPTNEGQGCDDKNACTSGETCKAGACAGGQGVTCTPPDTCHIASCDPSQGCVSTVKADGAGCDDDKYCTVNDKCNGGACQADPRDCNATAPVCHSGSCNETQKQCVYTTLPGGTPCDDGDPCTQGETCVGTACTPPPLLTEAVDTVHNMAYAGDRSLAVDGSGALHTAYHARGPNELWYATNASGAWKTEMVDGSGPDVGSWPTIALDAQGTVLIVYGDRGHDETSLAQRPKGSTSWQTSLVMAGQDPGHNSLVIDGAGKLHISFQSGKKLYFATGLPGALTATKVDEVTGLPDDEDGLHSSLALDSQGKVHIAHACGHTTQISSSLFEEDVTLLRYTTNASGNWVTSTPGGVAQAHGGFASIAIAAGGSIFIAHTGNTDLSASSGTLYLTHYSAGSGWAAEVVSASGTASSILLDSAGNLHAAYRAPVTGELVHGLRGASGGWTHAVLDIGVTNTPGWISLAREPGGKLHVTYEKTDYVYHASVSACP